MTSQFQSTCVCMFPHSPFPSLSHRPSPGLLAPRVTIEHVATLFIERRETARSNVHFEPRADWLPLTAVRELSCAQCLLLFKSYIIAVAALELGVILAGYPELLYMWVSACSIRFISPLHSYLIVLLLQLVQIHVESIWDLKLCCCCWKLDIWIACVALEAYNL